MTIYVVSYPLDSMFEAVSVAMDDEKRAQVRDSLGREGIKASPNQFETLIENISSAIKKYRPPDPKQGFRATHDALREIVRLADKQVPPIEKIRELILSLSDRTIHVLESHAMYFLQDQFPDRPYSGDVRTWIKEATDEEVLGVVTLAVTGSRPMQRSRGNGRRSRCRLSTSFSSKELDDSIVTMIGRALR